MNQATASKLLGIEVLRLVKTVKKEKHTKYLHRVDITLLSPRNDFMLLDNPNNRNVSISDDVNEQKASFSKTDNTYWPPGIASIVGGSIVNGIDKKLWNKSCRLKAGGLFKYV